MKILIISLLSLIILVGSTGCVYFGLGSTPTPATTITPAPINPNFTPPPTTGSQTLPVIPDFVSAISIIRPSVVAINTIVPAVSIFGGTLNQEGAGSGWIIDSSGLIVTNNHVVEGANSISVTLDDGRNFTAQLVRADAISDLAVIKIDAPDLQKAKVADSTKLKMGDWVAALGNSLGQGISATKGIVSALDVAISVSAGQSLYNLIQTDAAINPGNSGGPLVNLLGEVVGITSVKVAEVGVEGTGYAISTKEALPIISDLVKSGYVIRPWLGVSLYSVNQLVVLRYNLAVNEGALITQVAKDSPADKSGLLAGDVITGIDSGTGSKNVTSVDDLNTIIHGDKIGQQVTITYYRGTTQSTVSLTLEASPPA
jgi:serine protease Do